MNSRKLASAVCHRFALKVKLIEHGFCAKNSFVERGGVGGGFAPDDFDSQIVGNLESR